LAKLEQNFSAQTSSYFPDTLGARGLPLSFVPLPHPFPLPLLVLRARITLSTDLALLFAPSPFPAPNYGAPKRRCRHRGFLPLRAQYLYNAAASEPPTGSASCASGAVAVIAMVAVAVAAASALPSVLDHLQPFLLSCLLV